MSVATLVLPGKGEGRAFSGTTFRLTVSTPSAIRTRRRRTTKRIVADRAAECARHAQPRQSATATLAGAPPGRAVKCPASSSVVAPSDTMISISTSPRQRTVVRCHESIAGERGLRTTVLASRRTSSTAGTLSILCKHRAELADVLDFDRDVETDGAVVVGHGLHVEDVDLLVGQQCADVLEQADPVPRPDLDVDRVGLAGLRSPGDLDQSLGIGQIEHVRAIGAVDGDARGRASRNPRSRSPLTGLQQVASEVSRSPTPITSSRNGARGFGTCGRVGRGRSLVSVFAEARCDQLRRDRAVSDRREHVLDLVVAREVLVDVLRLEIDARAGAAPSPGSPCPGRCSRRAPAAGTTAGSFPARRGREVAEILPQPVPARAQLGLAGRDLDDLPVLQLGVEPDELVVDLAPGRCGDRLRCGCGRRSRAASRRPGSSMMSPFGVKT